MKKTSILKTSLVELIESIESGTILRKFTAIDEAPGLSVELHGFISEAGDIFILSENFTLDTGEK